MCEHSGHAPRARRLLARQRRHRRRDRRGGGGPRAHRPHAQHGDPAQPAGSTPSTRRPSRWGPIPRLGGAAVAGDGVRRIPSPASASLTDIDVLALAGRDRAGCCTRGGAGEGRRADPGHRRRDGGRGRGVDRHASRRLAEEMADAGRAAPTRSRSSCSTRSQLERHRASSSTTSIGGSSSARSSAASTGAPTARSPIRCSPSGSPTSPATRR